MSEDEDDDVELDFATLKKFSCEVMNATILISVTQPRV